MHFLQLRNKTKCSSIAIFIRFKTCIHTQQPEPSVTTAVSFEVQTVGLPVLRQILSIIKMFVFIIDFKTLYTVTIR